MAAVGHDVIGVEINEEKLARLQSGSSYFYEPGLDPRLRAGIDSGRLRFTNDFEDAMSNSEVVFLCVDTPPGENGHPDVTSVTAAAKSIGRAMHSPHVIVTKSTVPVGSGNWLTSTIESVLPDDVDLDIFSVVSNPEFLREGSAVDDFLYPERIVLGGDDAAAIDKVTATYRPILDQSFPGGSIESKPTLVTTDRSTAETIKYAANAFLATKISFINEIAEICEWVDADVNEVAHAIGLDSRISAKFLNAGVGSIAQALTERGAIVRAYDPMVKQLEELPNLQTATDPYTLVEQADAVVLLTEWDELRDLDFAEVAEKMRGNLVIDGRNAFDAARVREAGLVYEGMGRGSLPQTRKDLTW